MAFAKHLFLHCSLENNSGQCIVNAAPPPLIPNCSNSYVLLLNSCGLEQGLNHSGSEEVLIMHDNLHIGS